MSECRNRDASIEKKGSALVDAPSCRQIRNGYCAPAVAQSALAFHGIHVDQDTLASAMKWRPEPAPGVLPESQLRVYREFLGDGFEVLEKTARFETVVAEISEGRRPIVSEIAGHVRIVYGWRRETFGEYAYIGDPTRGERRLDNWEYPSHTRLIVIRRRLAATPGFS